LYTCSMLYNCSILPFPFSIPFYSCSTNYRPPSTLPVRSLEDFMTWNYFVVLRYRSTHYRIPITIPHYDFVGPHCLFLPLMGLPRHVSVPISTIAFHIPPLTSPPFILLFDFPFCSILPDWALPHSGRAILRYRLHYVVLLRSCCSVPLPTLTRYRLPAIYVILYAIR